MNCETCQAELIDYEHGELSLARRSEVARHLAECPVCALESCRLRADLEGIVDAYSEAPSSGVRQLLRQRVEAAVRPSWWARLADVLRRPIPVYAAAGVAVVPLAVWGALSLPRSAERTTTPSPPTVTDYDGATTRLNAPGVL